MRSPSRVVPRSLRGLVLGLLVLGLLALGIAGGVAMDGPMVGPMVGPIDGPIDGRRAVTARGAAEAAPPPAGPLGLTFEDLADDPAAGLTYRRGPSSTHRIFERLRRQPLYTVASVVATPEKPRGSPGVALLDFDGDGDLDLYVTNGPGRANSLFENRLAPTGRLAFVDRAEAAGVAATDQDSTGVCSGDLDNDGDPELVVLGRSEANRLFENRGDGTFREVTDASGVGATALGHTSCAVGDVDGDGLSDLAIANSYDWTQRAAIMTEPWDLSHPNLLLRNRGDLTFEDISETSGIRTLSLSPPAPEGAATLTWSVALVDLDLDGDLDWVQADDQGGFLPEQLDRGMIRVLTNDGAGRFTDITARAVDLDRGSAWMGLAFADFDCDGHLDLFATNMGDYAYSVAGIDLPAGAMASRWLLGRGDATFTTPDLGALVTVPFGWSVSAEDLDNDGDPDLAFYGSLDGSLHTVTADNPGIVLVNRACGAAFEADLAALSGVDHARRNIHGAAAGDLDRDGFIDLVSASAFDIPPEVPLEPYPIRFDSPFDPVARYAEMFAPTGNSAWAWKGIELPDGGLAVELGGRGAPQRGEANGWVTVRTLGTAGLLPGGRASRDGIGAVLRFTPTGGRTTLRPVLGGSGYGSQDALEAHFGLGAAPGGLLEVLWPGGGVTRLALAAGDRLTVPELPCPEAADPALPCLETGLEALVDGGWLEPAQATTLRSRLGVVQGRVHGAVHDAAPDVAPGDG